MRLFVGLPVPDAVRDRLTSGLAGLPERYPELRWTRPDGWHVTLAFLGEVEDGRVDEVAATVAGSVAGASTPAPALRLGEPGRFGRTTAWLGVEGDPTDAVATLAARVQTGLLAAGVALDLREVHPHLTLARARRRERLPRHLLDDLPRVEAAWTADTVVLYRSHLEPGGSRYEPVGRWAW